MRKSRLVLLLVATLLVVPALLTPPARAYQCLCEIYCWQTQTQFCYQDECCHLECCDLSDPTCTPFC